MPELSSHSFAICKELVDYTNKIDGYMVTFNRHNKGEYQANWHCTCVGFQYSPAAHKGCKHIDAAKKLQCTYDQFQTGDKPTRGGKCPYCAGPITHRNIAV